MRARVIIITGIAALVLATGTAHAGNCSSYQCGKIEVHSCYIKPSYNNDKFASDETTINIPEGMRNKTRRGNSTSGVCNLMTLTTGGEITPNTTT